MEVMLLVPVHNDVVKEHHCIFEQCCAILNDEWPRNMELRKRSLRMSKPDLPMSLAFCKWFTNDRGESKPFVLGHARLSRVLNDPSAVFIDSVIIHPDLRSRGLGKLLMLQTENFAKSNFRFDKAYLLTLDRQVFYAKLGYEIVENAAVQVSTGFDVVPQPLLEKLARTPDSSMDHRKSFTSPKDIPEEKREETESKSQASAAPANGGAPPAPPPPPPPRPSSSSQEKEARSHLLQECAKAFTRPTLESLKLTPLNQPPRILEVAKFNPEEGRSGCKVHLGKDLMRKLL